MHGFRISAVWTAALFLTAFVPVSPSSAAPAKLLPPTCGEAIASSVTLSSDITDCPGDGLELAADGITLDCAGHTISGTETQASTGLTVNGRSDVKIRNCRVTLFETGFRVNNSQSVQILSNNATDNGGAGFYMSLVSYSKVVGNLARGDLGGDFFFTGCTDNTLANNTAIGHSFGFSVILGSNGNLVEGNQVRGTLTGFVIAAANNTIVRNVASGNSYGFDVQGNNNNLSANVASGNNVHGFWTGTSTSGNVLTFNNSTGNFGLGFYDQAVPGSNTFSNDVCKSNSQGGSSPPGLCAAPVATTTTTSTTATATTTTSQTSATTSAMGTDHIPEFPSGTLWGSLTAIAITIAFIAARRNRGQGN